MSNRNYLISRALPTPKSLGYFCQIKVLRPRKYCLSNVERQMFRKSLVCKRIEVLHLEKSRHFRFLVLSKTGMAAIL